MSSAILARECFYEVVSLVFCSVMLQTNFTETLQLNVYTLMRCDNIAVTNDYDYGYGYGYAFI